MPGLVSRLLNLLATARGTTRNHKHIYPVITKGRYNAMDPLHKVKYRLEANGKYHLLPDNEWPHVVREAAERRAAEAVVAEQRAEEAAARSKNLNRNARTRRFSKMSVPPATQSPRRSKYPQIPSSFKMSSTGSPLSPSTRRNTTARNTRRLNTYDKEVQLSVLEYMNQKGKTVDETLRKLDSYSQELQDLILLSVGNGASLEEAFETADFYS